MEIETNDSKALSRKDPARGAPTERERERERQLSETAEHWPDYGNAWDDFPKYREIRNI